MHCEFLRLLFLQAHRETEGHFTAAGMSSQHNQLDLFLFKSAFEEQSRTCCCQSSGVEDQPQCPGMCHHSRPRARSLLRSPSLPPPSFTQSPSPHCSLVRDGQTSPHRPRLVVSRSTRPPLSPSPLTNSFIVGTAVINTHTNKGQIRILRVCVIAALQIIYHTTHKYR